MSERKISSDCNQIEIVQTRALLSTYNPTHKVWINSYRFGAPRQYHQLYSVKNRTLSSLSEHKFLSQLKNILPHLMSRGLTRFFYYRHLFFKKKFHTIRPNVEWSSCACVQLWIELKVFSRYVHMHKFNKNKWDG